MAARSPLALLTPCPSRRRERCIDCIGHALDLAGNNLAVNGLNSAGTIDNTAGGSVILSVGNNNASSTISGVVQNSGGNLTVDKTGAGTLTLSNVNNTYAGGTTINAGALNFAADGSLGAATGAVTFTSAGTLQATGNVALNAARSITITGNDTFSTQGNIFAVAGPISGTGSLTMAGGGTLVLGNTTNSYSGGTIVNGGNLNVAGDGALGAVNSSVTFMSAGTLQAGAAGVALNSARTITNAGGGLTLDNQGTNFSIASTIAGPGGLTVIGSGATTLSGPNTFGGAGQSIAVNKGTLVSADASALGSPANSVSVAAGATLSVSASANTGLAWAYYGSTAGNQATFTGPLTGIQSVVSNVTPTSVTNQTSLFSLPFATPNYVQAIGSGMIDITNSGSYTFVIGQQDDDAAIFVDGQTVVPGAPTTNGARGRRPGRGRLPFRPATTISPWPGIRALAARTSVSSGAVRTLAAERWLWPRRPRT